jgi:hypothetical protein
VPRPPNTRASFPAMLIAAAHALPKAQPRQAASLMRLLRGAVVQLMLSDDAATIAAEWLPALVASQLVRPDPTAQTSKDEHPQKHAPATQAATLQEQPGAAPHAARQEAAANGNERQRSACDSTCNGTQPAPQPSQARSSIAQVVACVTGAALAWFDDGAVQPPAKSCKRHTAL